ncbi:uncharacterized protein BDCG_17204 [Blastomyces dermatitidis ER-3]|uniref:Uncharacterized protein n=2 Tax=Ajellomyces dermatitidis TaxID=5039 RepID=A0A0J9ENJ9_AJEDA|nr:uncharacterized protein BDCG_17204 [Blastomyces dermatitidis ER-3]KMW66860.1 hypothetical protein BDDG_11758 [Blastomyces dermatitidis ATCC 18188]OAT01687.1 hypothetical protein BDCG_17204 [Blastomyces dermatitidis ER-3]
MKRREWTESTTLDKGKSKEKGEKRKPDDGDEQETDEKMQVTMERLISGERGAVIGGNGGSRWGSASQINPNSNWGMG